MSLAGIIIGLSLLIAFSFRGKSLLWAAPICAAIVALTGELPFLEAYTDSYMGGMVDFIKSWFPAFLLSSIFGKLMEATGGAEAVTAAIVNITKGRWAIFVSVLCAGVLAYGGVSGYVIIFSMYPIVKGLFEKEKISKSLIPAAIVAGAFTFSMSAFPGNPTIQNLIPIKYFGTTAFAAPVIGTICGILMLIGSVGWLEYRAEYFRKKGTAILDEETVFDQTEKKLPSALCAILPFLVIVVTLNGLKQDIVICLLSGIAVLLILNWKSCKNLGDLLNEGSKNAVSAVMNTASAVGFGAVVRLVSGFDVITKAVLSIQGSPLISEAIAVGLLAGATGSTTGGMTIALDVMADTFIKMSVQTGISLEVFHRVAAIAGGGLSTMPHDGAVVTYLAHCGITHKQGYFDIFVVSGLIPILMTILAIALGTMGIV